MTPLGSPCPDFALPGVDGRIWRRADFREPLLLVAVTCNHCPYVQAIDDRLNELAKAYAGRCAVVGINPNDAGAYPEDDFEAMRARAALKGYVFPYLHDEGLRRRVHAGLLPVRRRPDAALPGPPG
jgi:thiol-disulfide isomerase/thioredoxin